jgi:hypothetical protein
MSQRVQFENIEEMRRSAGIDDVELHQAIRRLQVGDWVRLTLSSNGSFPGEAVIVRITSIKGNVFRGKLAQGGRAVRRANVTAESLLTFTGDQIHSIPHRRAAGTS